MGERMTTTDQRHIIESIECKPEEAERITIQVGSTGDKYVLIATVAPARYDYHVIPVTQRDGVRWLLVPESRVHEQMMRYGSGLHAAVYSLDPTASGIAETIWKILSREVA
jgi:hypothetical protein